MTWSKPSPRRRKALPPRRVAARPAIEIVEDRTLLASHLVTVGTGTGPGTLYAAINAANLDGSGAGNVIEFGSGVTNVQLAPATALPELTRQVTIDGGTGGVLIDGAGTAFDGFRFASTAGDSVVHNLTIRDLAGAAIVIRADGVTVRESTLGEASEPVGRGVLIDGSTSSAASNSIHDNLIGFATAAGVEVSGAQATGNLIFNNRIGTDGSGGNRGNAVGVLILGSPSNRVGVDGANTIGFSAEAGVRIAGAGATGNVVQNNLIGVDGAGNAAGNPIGIDVSAVGAGPATILQQNSIDAASTAGVRIGGGARGVQVRSNRIGLAGTVAARATSVGVLVDGTAAAVSGVVVSGNTIGLTNAGVVVRSAGAAVPVGDPARAIVSGNFIGADGSGPPVGNSIGVWIDGTSGDVGSVIVGGTTDADRNTIGNSGSAGVRIQGARAAGNSVEGNLIGFNAAGQAMGNPIGVLAVEAGANLIASNWIGNSSTAGVQILDAAAGSVVRSNILGATPGGAAAANYDGVEVFRSAGSQIGQPGSGNTIGNSTNAGVAIAGAASTNNLVRGNTIGLTPAAVAAPNLYGVQISGAPSNTIGGAGGGSGNVIGHSSVAGVQIGGPSATGNAVVGNRIGVGPGGEDYGNAYGVQVVNSGGNRIGDSGASANVIGRNDVSGVAIFAGSNNVVQYNTYQATNGAPPIAASDINVAAGANGGVQPPAILTASPSGTDVRIRFTAPLQAGDVVQVYGFTDAARTFADERAIASAQSEINIAAASLGAAASVVVTVTRASGTSAFSNVVAVTSLLVVDTDKVSEAGKTSLWDAINNANSIGGSQTITFNLPVGSIIDASSAPLPAITTPIFVDGPGASRLTIAGGGTPADGLVFTASTDGSRVDGLTFRGFGGAAIRIFSAGVTVETSVFEGDAVGVALLGANNDVLDNEFRASATAGVLIDGATASGNEVYENTFDSNTVGVLVQNASDNKIGAEDRGNTIRDNAQAGVFIQAGARNSVLDNLYEGRNGQAPTPAPPVPPPVSTGDIVIPSGGNGGVQPPDLQSASPDDDDILIRFSTPLQDGDVLQIYGYTEEARTFAKQVIIAGDTEELKVPKDELVGVKSIVATVTRSNSSSAFSNLVTLANLLIVDTADFVHDAGRTSLWDAINNANSIGGLDIPKITFDLKDADGEPITNPAAWIIDVSANSLPAFTRAVSIDGTILIGGVDRGKVTVRGGVDGLTYGLGADGGTVEKLVFTGFTGAAVRVLSNGVTISQSDFVANPGGIGVVLAGGGDAVKGSTFSVGRVPGSSPAAYAGNAIGVQVLGPNNEMSGNSFEGSTIAAIQVQGVGASGNSIFSNIIGSRPKPTPPADPMAPYRANEVGIEVLGAVSTRIGGAGVGNTIQYSKSRGISVPSGRLNRFLENTFEANGPETSGVYSLSNNIFVGAIANDGVQPGTLLSAVVGEYRQPDGTLKKELRFVVQPGAGWDPTTVPPIQIYLVGPSGRATLFGYTGQDHVIKPDGNIEYMVGGATIKADDDLAVLGTVGANTTAFSNVVNVSAPNIVVNTLDDGAGSLRAAIAYVESESPTDRSIYFRISPDQRGGDGFWTIRLTSTLDVHAQVFIDGRNTVEPAPGAARLANDAYVAPTIRLALAFETPSFGPAFRFNLGSGASWVWGLEMAGFGSGVVVAAPDVTLFGNTILGAEKTTAEPLWQGTGVEVQAGGTGAVVRENRIGRWKTAVSITTAGANDIVDNWIGTDSQRDLGNGDGISISNSAGNFISGNTIGNNAVQTYRVSAQNTLGAAVRIEGGNATGNYVLGNHIGVRKSGGGAWFAIGNAVGVYLAGPGNFIGRSSEPGSELNVIGNSKTGVWIGATANKVAGNYIGVDPQGGRQDNTDYGVHIVGANATGNDIGLGHGFWLNVIGWSEYGVRIEGGGANRLRSNFIGAWIGGGAIPNRVGVEIGDSIDNVIGPDGAAAQGNWMANLAAGANFISGNKEQGVLLRNTTHNIVSGNLIGAGATLPSLPSTSLVAANARFLGNGGVGIEIAGGRGNMIGDRGGVDVGTPRGLVVGASNLILGNQEGVLMGDVAAGWGGHTIVGNLISANVLNGIEVRGDLGGVTRLATIAGNFVGTSFNGLSTSLDFGDRAYSLPSLNGLSGVLLKTTAGVPSAAATSGRAVLVRANLLSGNGLNGVEVGRAEGFDRDEDGLLYANVHIAGNIAGLNLAGAGANPAGTPFGNRLDGARIDNVGGVQVGGFEAGDANVLSGNMGRGVEVFWTRDLASPTFQTARAMTILIQGNRIGTNLTGSDRQAVVGRDVSYTGNLAEGIFLFGDVRSNVQSNTIGGNFGSGIRVVDDDSAGFGGRLDFDHNQIGTNALGADLYNGADGVFIDRVRVDSAEPLVQIRNNAIGANRANGIQAAQSNGVTITGNRIGALGLIEGLPGAEELGNFANGIFLNDSQGVRIGGYDAESRNIISGNRAAGVLISGSRNPQDGLAAPDQNVLYGNYIGTDRSGAKSVANHNSGVVINGSSGNWIGVPTEETGRYGGNVISGNRLYGVLIVGAASDRAANRVVGNLIGVDRTGLVELSNSADGVFLLDAAGSVIGVGPDPRKLGGDARSRNVISGNDAQGIRIFGTASAGNTIAGNYIGVGVDGAKRIPNKGNGVIVDNALPNVIGATTDAGRNVISGNAQSGIQVSSTTAAASGTRILGNYIGTNSGGSAAVPNGANGVFLFGASKVEVDDNVISGNSYDGVQIFSPSQNAHAEFNTLQRNTIGLDATGTRALGNQGNGVSIINGFGNVVGYDGGATGLGRNIISGNANGVVIDMQAGYGGVEKPATLGSPNRISGNIIGLDAAGKANLGNRYAGVLLNNADGTIVGFAGGFTDHGVSEQLPGTVTPGAGWASNVISGNLQVGVHLTGTTAHAKIRGNYIGTDVEGRTYDAAGRGLDLSSSLAAVLIDSGASHNWIGGVAPDESVAVAGTGNLITQSRTQSASDSSVVGVRINSIGAVDNHIQSNVIGLDATGSSGSNRIGVLLDNATFTTIGGPGAARNVITGNAVAGVEISGPLATRNTLFNNFIGTHANGTTRPAPRDPSGYPGYDPSQADGVLILQSSGNSVGYPGLGNLISGNGNGVNIASIDSDSPAASANYVVGNTIGTDASGMKALPNFRAGVFITAAPNNQVVGNLISANGLAGIQIFGGRGQQGGQGNAASLGTTIVGNTIGLNAAGQVDFSPSNGSAQIHPASDFPAVRLPDGITINLNAQQHGVVVIGASGSRIGLPGAGNGNAISGNTLTGVYISKLDNALQSYATPVDNVVQNNSLRTNGIYGVFRYDAPNGNPAVEAPSPNANDFTGTPIPIGDFITGLNTQTPNNPAGSALLGNAPTTPSQPGRGRNRRARAAAPAAVAPARPSAIQRPGMAQAARVRSR